MMYACSLALLLRQAAGTGAPVPIPDLAGWQLVFAVKEEQGVGQVVAAAVGAVWLLGTVIQVLQEHHQVRRQLHGNHTAAHNIV